MTPDVRGTPLIVRRSITVARPVADTFRIFTAEIGRWWPFDGGRFSWGGARYQQIAFEPWLGGRLYETFTDGEQFEIGRITAYEPPARIVYTWKNPVWEAATDVEVRFTPEGGGTRVEVVHSGFERIGPLAERARERYDSGWPRVLAAFAEHVAA